MKIKSETPDKIKMSVKKKYSEISRKAGSDACCVTDGCCSPGSNIDYTVFSDDYSGMDGYNADADLGLGCGLPTEFATIRRGDTVVDLGSGAGNDCFVARQETGNSGRVIGIDMTEEMVEKAKSNASKLKYDNMEFIVGDIEEIPLEDSVADVVISNCVLNLVPDKVKAFAEIFRILKKDGRFSISDVVVSGDLPDEIRTDAEMYAGCVAGAIKKEHYLDIVKNAGFKNISVKKIKEIQLPDELLSKYLTSDQIKHFRSSGTGIYSITLYAEK
ncbi:MAG: arsenite methyltransferase [Balneolaceae bacterium]